MNLVGHAPILGQQTLENADELAGHAPILGRQTLENADSNPFQFQFLNSNSIVSLGKRKKLITMLYSDSLLLLKITF